MSNAEWCLAGVTVVGLILWARGCRNRSAGSCALGLLLGIVAAIAYFVAFSLTRTSYLAVFLLAPFLIVLLLFRFWARTTPGKVLAAIVIILIGAAGLAEFKLTSLGNAMLVIEPYRSGSKEDGHKPFQKEQERGS